MRDLIAAVARALHIVVGAPRYEAYRAHVARCHPDVRPLSRDEFERTRLEAKYSKPGAKCC